MLVNQLIHGGVRALVAYDPTLFDGMVVPEGVNKQSVVDTILLKHGDTPLFSPDPAVMKYYIDVWSKKRLDQWLRYYNLLQAEYNPIENYDRIEEHEDYFTHGHKVKTDDKLTHGLKIKTDEEFTHGHNVENQISADNASTYQPDNKTLNSGKDTTDRTEQQSGDDVSDGTEQHSGTDEHKIKIRAHGNIGVVSSQQMMKEELNLIPQLNLADYIANDFKIEFCLYMYN